MNKTCGTAAVVGAGPCGVAAAVQLNRSGIRTLLFERDGVGGLLWNANLVENYPGFPRGIPGPALCRLMERHLHTAGIEPLFDEVSGILPEQGGYTLRTGTGRTFHAGAVILATGTRPDTGMVQGEERLVGLRIFYEVKDVLERDSVSRVAILGGSDAAYDYALNLVSRGCRVKILQRGPARCLPLLAARAKEHGLVEVLESIRVTGCREMTGGLELFLTGSGTFSRLEADVLLIACGRSPEQGLIESLQAFPSKEWGDKIFGTSLPEGLFRGGDLVRGPFRQAGIAVGDGLAAAMSAAKYLRTCATNGAPSRGGCTEWS